MVRLAIQSVLAQTLEPFEILIIDDHSSDGTDQMIGEFEKKCPVVRSIINETNIGITKVRNLALKTVSGDVLTFLDGDDLFHPKKLENEVNRMKESGAEIVFSNHDLINMQGELIEVWNKEGQMPEGNLFQKIFTRSLPGNRLYRSELINLAYWKSIGFYDEKINLYEDYDMRIRLSKIGNIAYADYVGSSYRTNPTGLSQVAPERHYEALSYIFEKNKGLLKDMPIDEQKSIDEFCHKLLESVNERIKSADSNKGTFKKLINKIRGIN